MSKGYYPSSDWQGDYWSDSNQAGRVRFGCDGAGPFVAVRLNPQGAVAKWGVFAAVNFPSGVGIDGVELLDGDAELIRKHLFETDHGG